MIFAQNHQQLGRILKDARLNARLQLAQVASELHIRPRYLQALEEGEFELLPGDTYLQGYLAQYAKRVGLDAREVTEAYFRIGALPARRFMHLSIPENIRKNRHPGSRLVTVTLGLSLMALFIWAVVTSSRAPLLSVMSPPVTSPRVIRTPECLKSPAAWPPCYWQRGTLFSVYPKHKPLRNIMELYEP